MAYLQDNSYNIHRKKKSHIVRYLIVVILITGIILLFRNFFKNFAYTVAVPVLETDAIVERGVIGFTHSKSNLVQHIQSLESENEELRTKLKDYSLIENENSGFKSSILSKSNGTIAAVVGKPSVSVYDTLLIILPKDKEIVLGTKAYTLSGVPMGSVTNVSGFNATVTLYSTPGVETNADIILSDAMDSTNVTMRGRGGGGFESIVPKDIMVPVGSLATIPSLFNEPFVEVVKTVARDDTKDQVVYLRSIVNFQYLRYLVLGE